MSKICKSLVWLVLLGAMMVIANACRQPEHNARVNLMAYADLNGNGEMDKGEPGLPDVLVTTLTNQHGAIFNISHLTGQDGMARFSVSYTHMFYLAVVPPCGYLPVGQVAFQEPSGTLRVGFRPVDPQPGLTRVTLTMFDDQDASGTRGADEAPLPGIPVGLHPAGDGYDNGAGVAAWTDEGGKVTFDLGNTCWDFYLRSDIYHQVDGENASATHFSIAVQPGENVFEIGLAPAPTPTALP